MARASSRRDTIQHLLNEEAEIPGQQNTLVDVERAAADQPRVAAPPQHVGAATDQRVLGVGVAVAIDQELAAHLDLSCFDDRRCRLDDPHIGDKMRRPRRRLLGPMHSGLDLRDARRQRLLALVEP